MKVVYYSAARVGEISPGTGIRLKAGEHDDIALFCTTEGLYRATGSLCPHQNEPLDIARLEGEEVICRRHHLRFDLLSGECTNACGYSIQTLPVIEENGNVMVGFWEEEITL